MKLVPGYYLFLQVFKSTSDMSCFFFCMSHKLRAGDYLLHESYRKYFSEQTLSLAIGCILAKKGRPIRTDSSFFQHKEQKEIFNFLSCMFASH